MHYARAGSYSSMVAQPQNSEPASPRLKSHLCHDLELGIHVRQSLMGNGLYHFRLQVGNHSPECSLLKRKNNSTGKVPGHISTGALGFYVQGIFLMHGRAFKKCAPSSSSLKWYKLFYPLSILPCHLAAAFLGGWSQFSQPRSALPLSQKVLWTL